MTSAFNSQLGLVQETTYGTAVTVTKFYEFNSESIQSERGRVESRGQRPSQFAKRSDHFVTYQKGASGSIEMDVMSKGFGFLLKHMLGSISTSTVSDSNYTHTATIGSHYGSFFTAQVNRPFHPAGTDQAVTYAGGKVKSWKLSAAVEETLKASLDVDFQNEVTNVALASASYPTSQYPLTFVTGALTISGTAVPVTKFDLECDNKLKLDRNFINLR